MQDYTVKDITDPKEGYIVFKNRYWVCQDGDPTKALFYKQKYPQCNHNSLVVKNGLESYPKQYNALVVFVPTAYIYNPYTN